MFSKLYYFTIESTVKEQKYLELNLNELGFFHLLNMALRKKMYILEVWFNICLSVTKH